MMQYRKMFVAFLAFVSLSSLAHAETGGTATFSSPLFGKITSILVTTGTGWTSAELLSESGATVLTGVVQINGNRSVPPIATAATGTGIFVINTNNNTLNYHITHSWLSSAETSAHIHGPADPNTNSGVIFPLPVWLTKSGVLNYTEAQEQDIVLGRTYINIHSNRYPDGEIRGQLYFPSRLALSASTRESILSELSGKIGANMETIRSLVTFVNLPASSATGALSPSAGTGAISATGTTSGTGASSGTGSNSGTGMISATGTTTISGTGVESLRQRSESLRNQYASTFNSFGRKLDAIDTARKELTFNMVINRIDAKMAQIKNSNLTLESKQKFLLLYGDLRLMLQKKLADIGARVNSMKNREAILSDISSIK